MFNGYAFLVFFFFAISLVHNNLISGFQRSVGLPEYQILIF